MAVRQPIRILNTNQTEAIFAISARVAQTTIQLLSCNGNSILSSVFVKNADAGTTVKVNYFQTTSGTLEKDAERQDIGSHRELGLSDIGTTDTILVTRIHNKPACEIVVVGPGTIEFGVYVSIRSETASDLDSALKIDTQVADLLSDKGIPIVCLDESGPTSTWNMVRCGENGLLVDVSGGAINLQSMLITDVESASQNVAYGNTITLLTYNPASDTRLHQVVCSGDGSGDFTIKINGVVWAKVLSSWNNRSPLIPLHGKLLTTSDTITIEVENTSPTQSGSCNYQCYIHRGLV